MNKEHREEVTYRDKHLGAQAMIEAMMNPIFMRKKARRPKGPLIPP